MTCDALGFNRSKRQQTAWIVEVPTEKQRDQPRRPAVPGCWDGLHLGSKDPYFDVPQASSGPRSCRRCMNVLFFLATSIPAGLALIGALVCTWQIRWAWTLLGAVILDTFCLWLKKLIQQPRPATPAFVLDSEGLFRHAVRACRLCVLSDCTPGASDRT